MDWLWPIYLEHIGRILPPGGSEQHTFMQSLVESTATLFAMEPIGDTIRFKGLGRWPLPEVPDLLADPNAFIANRYGGGKYKVNFHHVDTFVGTHNFRTWGDELWRDAKEVVFD